MYRKGEDNSPVVSMAVVYSETNYVRSTNSVRTTQEEVIDSGVVEDLFLFYLDD